MSKKTLIQSLTLATSAFVSAAIPLLPASAADSRRTTKLRERLGKAKKIRSNKGGERVRKAGQRLHKVKSRINTNKAKKKTVRKTHARKRPGRAKRIPVKRAPR